MSLRPKEFELFAAFVRREGKVATRHALSGATVAIGWSGYFVSFLHTIGIEFRAALATAPGTTTMTGEAGIFKRASRGDHPHRVLTPHAWHP